MIYKRFEVNRQIERIMKARGWSAYRLSKESDLAYSTVDNLFRRNNAPTLHTLESICRGFGITLAEFFTRDDGDYIIADNSPGPEFAEEELDMLNKWKLLSPRQQAALIELSTLFTDPEND